MTWVVKNMVSYSDKINKKKIKQNYFNCSVLQWRVFYEMLLKLSVRLFEKERKKEKKERKIIKIIKKNSYKGNISCGAK